MKPCLLFILLGLTGCNFSKLYPSLLAGGGAGAGAAIGGPGGAVLGGISGAALGEVLIDESPIDPALLAALTKGDVAGIVDSQLHAHKTGLDAFISNVTRVLWIAAGGLIVYLFIPFIWTHYCVKRHTRKADGKTKAD